jgi:flagella basal body P-ring formation protein FlgA
MAMTRTIITLAVLLVISREAAAQAASAPRLKELVTVTSEIVRIGDLVENAGAAANVAVFRAPDLGQTGTVPIAAGAEALRPHDVAGLDTGGLTEVVVTRLSRTISSKDIAERLTRAFAGQFGFGDARSLNVTVDRDVRILHVEATATADLAVARMHVEPRTGRFNVAFELPGSASARRLPLRFTGTVTEMVETATLLRSVKTGDVIKASDVITERRPKAEVGDDAISAEQATGLSAKRSLRSGQPLRAADLMRPHVVRRNQSVTITYEVPGILLTVRGKALEAGAVGDIVGVLNVQSNRTIQAAVVGPGRVSIAPAVPLVAAAMTSAPDHPAQPRTQ